MNPRLWPDFLGDEDEEGASVMLERAKKYERRKNRRNFLTLRDRVRRALPAVRAPKRT